jgi:hypothetical protein
MTATVPYGGSSSIKFDIDGPSIAVLNTTSVQLWYPNINPTIVGKRDVSPTAVVGSQSGDTLVTKFSAIPADIGSAS